MTKGKVEKHSYIILHAIPFNIDLESLNDTSLQQQIVQSVKGSGELQHNNVEKTLNILIRVFYNI